MQQYIEYYTMPPELWYPVYAAFTVLQQDTGYEMYPIALYNYTYDLSSCG